MFELKMLAFLFFLSSSPDMTAIPNERFFPDEASCNAVAKTFVASVYATARVTARLFGVSNFTVTFVGGCRPAADVPMM